MDHLTYAQLQDFFDRLVDDATRQRVESHLHQCPLCRSVLSSFGQLDDALRKLPLERTSASFTKRVLKSLGIETTPALAPTLIRSISPLVLLAFAAVALSLFSPVESVEEGGGVGVEAIDSFIAQITKLSTDIFESVGEWLEESIAFIRQSAMWRDTFLVLLVVTAIALLDRLVLLPRIRRRG